MISIIVCSINELYFSKFAENIEQTIGVEHEIIRIDNSQNEYSICSAYNKGAVVAKYDKLCFVHEDVAFISKNWGTIISGLLNEKNVGIVGVAGGLYFPMAPAPWWCSIYNVEKVLDKFDIIRTNVVHMIDGKHSLDPIKPKSRECGQVEDVGTVDGVFMAMRRTVWEEFKFDEITFNRFHFYDVDISLNVSENYRNCISYNIQLQHFSLGTLNREWVIESIKFVNKWRNKLPRRFTNLSNGDQDILEEISIKDFLRISILRKVYSREFLRQWIRLVIKKGISVELVKELLRFSKGFVFHYFQKREI